MIRIGRKVIWRTLLLAGVLVLAAGLIVPRLDADRFGKRVQATLQQALGRTVEIGKVRLDVFHGPGFSVDKVIIYDDPAVTLEPFAYVESLEARISFKSIWTGRLEFSSLSLENPSVNLSLPSSGNWNFGHFLARSEAAKSAVGGRLPGIQIHGGRINFKFEDVKSVFYLSDVSLEATPPGSFRGEWRVRFDGEPARNDRSTRSFGRFTVTSRWKPGGPIDASLELEKSSLSDFVRLFHGHDVGVHGQMRLRARFSGPAEAINIVGRAELSDVHRWDLLPPHSGMWPLDIGGTLDVRSQTLELHSSTSDGTPLPLELELRASGYLSRPRWAALARLEGFPLAPLPEVARHMGLGVPPEVALTGQLTGAIGYSPDSNITGSVLAQQVSVALPGSPPVELPAAAVRISGGAAHLEPSDFTAAGSSAAVEADYNWRTGELRANIAAAGMPIEQPQSGARLFEPVPILGECRKGLWRGQVEYRYGTGVSAWSGLFQLENALFDIPGLSEPLELLSARVAVRDDGVTVDRITGRAGTIDFKGDYRHAATADTADQLRIAIPQTTAADIERTLLPSLRRTDSLLSRALRFGRASVPDWLAGRHAEASVNIQELLIGETPLERVRTRLRWDGTAIEAPEVSAQLGDGSLRGRFTANLRRAMPSYRLNARFRSIGWSGAKWDGRGTLQTSGTGEDLMRNLRFDGAFESHSFALTGETEATGISGTCSFAMASGLPVFTFPAVEITIGETALKGAGATSPDGRVHFDLFDGLKRVKVTGTLSPLQLEFAAQNTPGRM